jgi:hypothetical protein
MGLERIETKKGHKYLLDGQPVKGVTTLIGSGMPKPALPYWSAKLVAEYVVDNYANLPNLMSRDREEVIKFLKSVPWEQRDKAGARGTEIHALAEKIVHGNEVEVSGELADYIHGYIQWLDQWSVKPVLIERVVANRSLWYAGTFDAILKFESGPLAGKTYLCDWKTSNSVYGEMAMQIAAYANADFYLDDYGNEVPLPEIDGLGIVHISPNGTTFHDVKDVDLAWDSFLTVVDLATRLEHITTLLEQIGGTNGQAS